MNSPHAALSQAALEAALDDLIANQRGIDFQRIAIPLAVQRRPDIVANEVTKDGGEDGFIASVALDDKHLLAVGSSLTATWRKIRDDLRRVKGRKPEVSAFWFYTPQVVTTVLTDKWRDKAEKEFTVSLTVISREDTVQRLLEPQNHYLARYRLGLAVPTADGLEEARQALAESKDRRIEAWLRHYMDPRLSPVDRDFGLTHDPEMVRSTLNASDLAERFINGGIFLISGEGGLGKTVTLGQLASQLSNRERGPVPVLISAPSWARSGLSLAAFLAGQLLGAGEATAAALHRLMTHGDVAVFLNGWNEVAQEHVQRLSAELTDIKLSAPGCALVLSARSSTAEGLGPVSAFHLAPLSPQGRRQVVEQLSREGTEDLLTTLQREPEVEALSRIPLFLVPLIDTLRRGDSAPRERHELLEAALVSIERIPDHERELNSPLVRNRYRTALRRIGFELSLRGTTEASRDDAVSWLASITDGELQPDALLDVLLRHHVLMVEGGRTIRFQHPYFQDWMCAQHMRRMIETGGQSTDEQIARLIDDRRLEPAWMLLVAALAGESNGSAQSGTVQRLLRIALKVDYRLAAEWTHVLGTFLQATQLEELKVLLRQGISNGGAAKDLALAGVLAAKFSDFADEFWRLLESPDQQVRLSTYRLREPLPVEVLGPNWRARVNGWPPDRRAEFAMEAGVASSADPLVLTKDFASRDPSPEVRGKCLAHVGLYDPAAAHRLFATVMEVGVGEILDYGTLDFFPRELIQSHLPHIERLARSVPLDYRGSRALNYLRETDPARVLDIYKRQLSAGITDIHQAHSVLEFVSLHDRQWASGWVLGKLTAGEGVPEEFEELLGGRTTPELTAVVAQLLARSDLPRHGLGNLLKPFLRLGRPEIVRLCMAEMIRLEAEQGEERTKLTEPEQNCLLGLHQALRDAPLQSVATILAEEQQSPSTAKTAKLAVNALADSASNDPDGVPSPESEAGANLQALTRRFAEIILAADDPHGYGKAAVARLIGLTGYRVLHDLLQRLIAAETTRVLDLFSEARQPGGRRRSGGYSSHVHWYVPAVSEAGGTERVSELLSLFENEIFEIEAGQELVRLAGIPSVAGNEGAFGRTAWTAVAQEHCRVGERLLANEAQAIAAVVDRHVSAWEARTDPPIPHGSRERRIAALTVMYARLTGHLRIEPLLALEPDPGWPWIIEGWLHALLRCGITVPSEVADRTLQTWVSPAPRVWRKPDENLHMIKQLLIALMFSDDLNLATQRIREFIPQLKPSWERREILVPLAASAVPERIALLLEAFPDSNNDTYWHEWTTALGLLPAAGQRAIVEALITNPKWTASRTHAEFRVHGVMDALAPVIQSDASLRQRLNDVVRLDSDLPMRTFARHLLIAVGDAESAKTALDAALAHPTLRSFAEAAIRRARWYSHPDRRRLPDYNVPQSLAPVRARLLEVAHHGEESERAWATRLLSMIDSQVEESGSYPIDEPRHPNLASGLPWPIVA